MFELMKSLAMPSQIGSVFLLGGIALLFLKTRRRVGIRLALGGRRFCFFFSSGLTASLLMSPLEYRNPPILDVGPYADIHTAVVLTAFATDDKNMPLSSRAGSSTVYRVLEVSRLAREGNVGTIIVSGDPVAAPILRDLLISIGLPGNTVQIDSKSHNTIEKRNNERKT